MTSRRATARTTFGESCWWGGPRSRAWPRSRTRRRWAWGTIILTAGPVIAPSRPGVRAGMRAFPNPSGWSSL
eukprot:8684012-Alexandrium_andersonii.AAC.1